MTEPEHVHGLRGDFNELVMPFVATKSNGGQLEDRAFVGGWRCAEIDTVLCGPGACYIGWIALAELPQVELIAMRHERELVQTCRPTDDGMVAVFIGWSDVADMVRKGRS